MIPTDLVPNAAESGTLFVVRSTDVPTATRALAAHGQVQTADEWIDSVTQETRQANNLGLVVLLGPAGLYAGIAIVNATLIGASQRRRENHLIALLGATPDQVRRAAVWQAAITSGAGLLLGTTTTAMTRVAIVRDLADAPGSVDVPMTVPWLPLAAIAVTCLLLACLAALAGARTHGRRPGPS